MEDKELYSRARNKVLRLKGFYIHLSVYLIVMTFLATLNILTYSEYLWFIWPALGWGLGLFFHGMSVFAYNGMLGEDWEKKKINQFMEKARNNQ